VPAAGEAAVDEAAVEGDGGVEPVPVAAAGAFELVTGTLVPRSGTPVVPGAPAVVGAAVSGAAWEPDVVMVVTRRPCPGAGEGGTVLTPAEAGGRRAAAGTPPPDGAATGEPVGLTRVRRCRRPLAANRCLRWRARPRCSSVPARAWRASWRSARAGDLGWR